MNEHNKRWFTWPIVAVEGTAVPLISVTAGTAADLLAAFAQAQRMAATLALALEQAGVADDVIVVPSLTEDGQPVITVRLTPDGMIEVGRLLIAAAQHPPPHERPPDPEGGRVVA